QSISTTELNIALTEGSNGHQVIDELAAKAKFEGATEIITIDGLRVEFPDGFGLMRASNTTPILVLRFEADTQEAIERIQNQFKAVIESTPTLICPL
ncbi:phosphomannomutase/phosphoglucomutase, partial [Escherichia coli]|nr:phosphomannomutase/phosphoglucomutase [Escherichia coli]